MFERGGHGEKQQVLREKTGFLVSCKIKCDKG